MVGAGRAVNAFSHRGPGDGVDLEADFDEDGAVTSVTDRDAASPRAPVQPVTGPPAPTAVKYEHRLTLACGSTASPDAHSDVTNCSAALVACAYAEPPSEMPQMYVWRKPAGDPSAPWEYVSTTCIVPALPGAPPPPAVPTMGQIQTAFRQLPFSKPTVRVEPRGNVTLVNLPTYYEATWPGDQGLEPGEVSAPVQLLSWSVEFKIASRSYTFHYGDGASSGPVTDAGGGHPDGAIRHTYTEPIQAAQVRVDAQLTGQFRVNGGEWTDISTVADLQDEPVTTLAVKEAKARLYSN